LMADSLEIASWAAYRIIDQITMDTANSKANCPNSTIVKNLHSIKENESNLADFVNQINEVELASIKKALDRVEAKSILEIFERLEKIKNKKEPTSKEDQEFLLEYSSKYEELKKEKTMDIYMTHFVRKHKGAIIKEMINGSALDQP